MDLTRFLEMTDELDEIRLRRVSEALGDNRGTAGDTVDWWQAVLAVDRAHRVARTRRAGAAASRRACASVLAAAERAGMAANSDEVVAIARAASTIGWALAADASVAHAVSTLLRPWLAALSTAKV